MNLLTDPWIPVFLKDGTKATISPAGIADQQNPPMRVAWPRPDFRLGAMELLIGIMAVALAPSTEERLLELQSEKPSEADLRTFFAPIAHAFNFDGDGPRFMQDFDPHFEVRKKENENCDPILLLIDGPGGRTAENNTDWFVKRAPDKVVMSRATAAMALYVLQTYAPKGGRGHMTGFRGGGPLTTLVIPFRDATLYDIVLANLPVLKTQGPIQPSDHAHIFSWLAPMPTTLTPQNVHELQAFFGMPRRIRLHFQDVDGATCHITGDADTKVVTGFRRAPYGIRYSDIVMRHPLSPYAPKKGKYEAVAAKSTGIGWNDYLGLAVGNSATKQDSAASVTTFRDLVNNVDARIYAAGFAMADAKAEAFVEAEMPMPLFTDKTAQAKFDRRLTDLIEASALVSKHLQAAVFYATGSEARTFDVNKTLMHMVERRFWEETQNPFNKTLSNWTRAIRAETPLPDNWGDEWREELKRVALNIYDDFVDLDPKHPRFAKAGKAASGKEKSPYVRAVEQRKRLWFLLHGYSEAGCDLYRKLGLLPTSS